MKIEADSGLPTPTSSIVLWSFVADEGGLKPSLKKGFKFYVEGEDPDVLVLTETKVCISLAFS